MKKHVSLLLLLAACLMAGCSNSTDTLADLADGETRHESGYTESQLADLSATIGDKCLLHMTSRSLVVPNSVCVDQFVQLRQDGIPVVYGYDESGECIAMGDCCSEKYEKCQNYYQVIGAYLTDAGNFTPNWDEAICNDADVTTSMYSLLDDGISYQMCCNTQDDSINYLIVLSDTDIYSFELVNAEDYGDITENAIIPPDGECSCGCD